MALKIYYQEDIKNALDAVNTAQGATTAQAFEQLGRLESAGAVRELYVGEAKEHIAIFRAGFSAALAAVAAAFGLEE